MRTRYDIKNYDQAQDNVKLRNFEPKIVNQNSSRMVNIVDETKQYWDKRKVGPESEIPPRPSTHLKIKNVAINSNVMMTKQEFEATEKIAR